MLLSKQNVVSIPDKSANMSSLWSCMTTQVYVLSDLTLNLGDFKKISDLDHGSLDEKIIIYYLFYLFIFFTLQYCIGFVIHQHESTTGVHVFPVLNPPPTSLPIPSLWVIPVHQPQVSCIPHWTWTGNSFLMWYYTCFNAILPNHVPPPSPTDKQIISKIYKQLLQLNSRKIKTQ